jgi:RNA polymerase sigma factor (sigma-70 family)
MAETPKNDPEGLTTPVTGEAVCMDEIEAWFVREVLPLEAVLIQYLSRGGRSRADVEDMCQDLYEKVCAAAQNTIPSPTRPFVFTVARNLLINRAKHEQVVSFESVENLEELYLAIDEPAPDRVVIARQELRNLQAALDQLSDRHRNAIVMRKVQGLSVREISQRAGVPEKSIERHLTEGMRFLADILLRNSSEGGAAR